MSIRSFIFSSARHYAKAHLGLLFGVFLASAMLSGSLLVGDSVKASLRRVAELRLGKIRSGMVGGERWFTEELARKVQAAPMIVANGSVSAASGTARVNAAQVLGVDDAFWRLSPNGRAIVISGGQVWINEPMAAKLNAKVGDAIIVSLEKPSALSRDAPLSGKASDTLPLRRTIGGILRAEDFGAFQLQASQVSPDSVFFGLNDLQGQVEMVGRCNAGFSDQSSVANDQFARQQGLADFALQLRRVKTDQAEWELATDRVFVDEVIANDLKSLPKVHGALTYLVNAVSSAAASTPYSMVTATDVFHSEIKNQESGIIITQWLADDQKLKIGDKVDLRYFVSGATRALVEQTTRFTVSAILPMNDPRVNRAWTPPFPGMPKDEEPVSSAQSDKKKGKKLVDWDPGFPLNKKAIRDQDEKYWDEFRGTPKAFISLEAGQKMWGNRFGKLTAIRFADTGQNEAELKQQIVRRLRLEDIGLTVQDFKAQADAAAAGSVDFGGLFAGLSMFLIAAALVFAALLFVFLIERRASQAGLLMAIGWSPKLVRRALVLEAGVIALIGSALGLLGGVAYTKAALAGLNGAWGGATAGLQLVFAAETTTLVIAFVASFGIAMLTLWWMTRRLLKAQPRELLAGGGDAVVTSSLVTKRLRWWSMFTSTRGVIIESLVLSVVLLIAGTQATNAEELGGMFFGSGMMLMLAMLALAKHWMNAQARSTQTARSLWQIGLRNVTRRPGRSLAILGMMAGGIFLVVAVNAFRLSADADTTARDSGTGGFALVGESSLPIYEDLNTKVGRDAFGLDEEDMYGATVLPFRVRPGDDASCLNLNRAQTPQLVGVNTAKLVGLKAFGFANEATWSMLVWPIPHVQPPGGLNSDQVLWPDEPVPAACDQATAMWGLQKGVGDIIEYDVGGGKKLRVKLVALLAGSVLQGKLIIDEQAFIERLPNVSGYKFFLVDATPGKAREVSESLTKQLEPRGLALESTAQRLNAFSAVQNTYIGIFTVLGGLGVLLGTAGIGVLVARHVLERRGELGLMQAVGFLPSALQRMIVGEHSALLLGGVVIGTISAAVAVWPSLAKSAHDLPLSFIGGLIAGIVVAGVVVCTASASLAMRGRLLDAVRRE